jgi:hypothetical protein
MADAQIDFDADTLELTIGIRQLLPQVSAVDHIETDILGNGTGAARVPGPLANPGAKRAWKVDPRSQPAVVLNCGGRGASR